MGARKEERRARLDVSHHKPLTPEDVANIERVANEVVAKRLPVEVRWYDRHEAERLFGFTLYQGGEAPAGQVRVVNIQGWDAEACGGTHCANTSEVGFIKVIGTEKIADGVVRIEFAAGPAALEYVQSKISELEGRAERSEKAEREISTFAEKLFRSMEAEDPTDPARHLEYVRAHYSAAARYWFSSRKYQKEEEVEGVRVIFDFTRSRNELLIDEMLQQVSTLQFPAVVLLIRSVDDRLEFRASLNRQALNLSLLPVELAQRMSGWREDVRVEASERELKGEVTGTKVGELYNAFTDAIRSLRRRQS
jgi:alanyl-tRNA synthetase